MALQQHRSRHPVDVLPPLRALDPARHQRPFRRSRGQALVDELHGKAGFVANRSRQLSGGRGLRTTRAVEAQGEAYDDPPRLVVACNLREPRGQGVFGPAGNRRQRLGDGLARVAQGEADTLRAGIDREDPHRSGYGGEDGVGVGDAVAPDVDGGGTPDWTT
jgi:hypothetical protein